MRALTVAVAVAAVGIFLPTAPAFAQAIKSNEVTKDKIGQLVKLEGTASSFRASRGERSPNSFMLKDSAGEIRIVIWPEAFKEVANSAALQANGVQVQVEGEVNEFREKLEIHVPDGQQLKVGGTAAGAGATTATVTATTTTTGTR